LNILLVIADLALGGAQQVVINLANELVNQNHKVWIFDIKPEIRNKGMLERLNQKTYLISKNYSEVKISFKEKIVDYVFYKLKIKTDNKKKLFNRHEQNLQKILLNNKVDYVNSHVCWADFFVYDNLKNLHEKWIISLHASYNALLNSDINADKYGEKAIKTLTTAKKIIYLHNDGISFLEKRLEIEFHKKKKIYNGIPKNKKYNEFNRKKFNIEKNDFVILCGSRASKLKGWFELAEAVVKLNNPKIKLLFAGDGEILDDIKIKFSSNKTNIFFLGFQKKIINLISISDVICLPSYTEALPTILLESIFYNKPVIATNVGETASILENKEGRCGVLINANKGEELVKDLTNTIDSFMLDNLNFDKEAFDEAKALFSSKKMAQNYLNYFGEN
jgi:glycosyltransferase involved in cell wall biosynthesis